MRFLHSLRSVEMTSKSRSVEMTETVKTKFLIMKKIFVAIFAISALIVTSCKNKVDLYTDDGEHTVVYAMLDPNADTNFFKITKSFVGNVNEYGQDYDANNYKYDEIEVKFSGVFDGDNHAQTVTLDTVSKWIPYDENSTFYSGCRQTYYYTTKTLLEGQEYTLNIFRKTDSVNISGKSTTINTFRYKRPISTQQLTFTDVTTTTNTVEWKFYDPATLYKTTAAYFEIDAYFHYKELMPGATDTVHHSIRWAIASGEADRFYTNNNNDFFYVARYAPAALYSILGSNGYLKNNSPGGVQRWFEKFEFRIEAIGDELYRYYLATNSSSAIQDVPNYTNIENGMGILSSRITKSTFHTIAQISREAIIEKFPEYGFIYDPNR